jgi:membrane-associated protease RseP (regulator of RpoE activity)
VTTILAFLFVLGVLVFVHELGHFLAARRIGVRVLTFSLGFGPKLLSTKRGDTEYAISAIPLGGYVKMAGESVEDPRSGAPDEFLSKTKWQRFQVLIMGPVMNILLAVIVMAIVLAQGAEVPAYHDQPPVVGAVKPGSPAEQAGLQRGDRVLAVAGNDVPTWDRFDMEIGTRANRELSLTFLRDGRTQTATVRPDAQGKYEIGDIGVVPDATPIVASLVKGDVAEKAGLKAGDVVVAVDGERMVQRSQLTEVISSRAGKPTDLTIRRNGQSYTSVFRSCARSRDDWHSDRSRPSPSSRVRGGTETQCSATSNSAGSFSETLGGCSSERRPTSADGAGRHCTARRIRAGRLDCAVHADGVDQPQPGPLEPDADPHPRWRSHPDHGARRHCAPGLQRAGKREDAAGRICAHPAPDGDGHL